MSSTSAIICNQLQKCPTGIDGFDSISYGGLPKNRTSLVCGASGCGKTLFAMQFLINGAVLHKEPGVFMSFEENETELAENFASLGVDLTELTRQNVISVDYVDLTGSEIAEAGEYDLEGLFVRLDLAISSIGAKRVVLDTIEALFAGLSNVSILRTELRRLFRWLKERGVTAVITAEQGSGTLTRYGIEEYVSDCVITLDHNFSDRTSTRKLSIRKYRGSPHGTNEYPFLINDKGICIMPITSVELNANVSTARVSTGVGRLDTMLGGNGYFIGSSVLITGTSGTGKSTLAAKTADAACARGEKCLIFAFEESQSQIIRNMASVGMDLSKWVDAGLLRFSVSRPTFYGIEMHLVTMYNNINEFKPNIVVIDPISDFSAVGNATDVKSMLTRLLDFLKHKEITTILLDLSDNDKKEQTSIGVSSLIDTWIALRDIELNGERNRGLYILKSRGMNHSNQIREFVLTDRGIELRDVYTGPEGVLTGTARLVQEAREKAKALAQQQEIERKLRDVERKRIKMETMIADLQAAFEAEKEELETIINQEEAQIVIIDKGSENIAQMRKAD
jgi:circadian clock protein KaiC